MTARINLLPWREWARQRRKRRFFTQLGLAATAAAAIVVLAGVGFGTSIGQQEQRNRFLASNLGDLDERIAELDELVVRRDRVVEQTRALDQLLAGGSNTRHLLDEFARTAVPGAYYTSITRRGDVIAAQGKAESNDRIAALMRNLQDSSAFDAPLLESIEKGSQDAADTQAATFELTFTTSGGT
ncbi:MAG: PilN domain-containing protein [Pseudomonadales bacterium]|nr:PilN domain-containing protein [Pseudomonadales bacterium]